jgi:hypothetical protein
MRSIFMLGCGVAAGYIFREKIAELIVQINTKKD